MAPKNLRSITIIVMVLILLQAFIPPGSAHALVDSPALPELKSFIDLVKDGRAGVLRGVYVAQVMAASVVQQPDGRADFVSPRQNILTQFSPASKFGATGLLAHNYLAGASFSLMKPGQILQLVYGDGRAVSYVIKEVHSYQAVSPLSTTSDFIDLKTSKRLSARDLMNKMYNRPGKVIFQTCLAKDKNQSWGRIFVIAEPYPEKK